MSPAEKLFHVAIDADVSAVEPGFLHVLHATNTARAPVITQDVLFCFYLFHYPFHYS